MSNLLLAALLPAAAWLFMACAPQTGGPVGGSPSPSSPEPAVPPAAQEAVVAAKKDLAARTKKGVEELRLVTIEEAEWRDSSLGCPEPGKLYAQVITPGFRLVLTDGAGQYEYHSDARGNVVFCFFLVGYK